MQNDCPVCAVDDGRIVVGDQVSDSIQTGNQRDIQISRDDRGVGGRSAGFDGESDDLLPPETHSLGGGQIVGDDDHVAAELG